MDREEGRTEDGEEEAEGCCQGVKTCAKVTYDIFRSIPLLTIVWAGGAIAASNLGVGKVQTVGMSISLLQNFERLFEYMTYFLYYIDAVNAASRNKGNAYFSIGELHALVEQLRLDGIKDIDAFIEALNLAGELLKCGRLYKSASCTV